MGERAVQPGLAAAIPAPVGMDGAGWPGGQFFPDASGRDCDTGWTGGRLVYAPAGSFSYAGLVVPADGAQPTFLTSALSILFLLNLLLGTFNLLPVPPLDGYAGIMVIMPEGFAQRYIEWVQRSRNFALLGLIIAWTMFDRIFQPIFYFALHTLYAGVHSV